MTDFSDLIAAVEQNKKKKIDKLLQSLRPRLMAFLRIHMSASYVDAEDCTQDTLIMALKAIKEDKIKQPKYIVQYVLTMCKNNYLRLQRKHREIPSQEQAEEQKNAPRQLNLLLDAEKKKLLKSCMDQLKKMHRRFIQYWFDFPGTHAQKVADYFDISINSVWTRKHRVIKKLHECYQKKSKL